MPQALNTVSLLKSASQRLGLGPHHAMQIAERLYLGGFITYPRTETNCYPPSFDLNGAVMQQTNNPYWGADARQILTKGLARPRSGTDAGDHPPITPVKSATESEVGGGDSWRLYELVCRNFLASVAGNCKFKKRTISFEASKEEFSASAKICIDPGFSTVLRQTEVRDTLLPDLKPGDTIPIESVNIEEKVTSPPPYLSESDLLSLLEKHRIGTDASMASHINNICERNYVSLVGGRRLQPTKLGVCLVHGYMAIDSELVLPFVRASIEQLVDVIAKGKASREAVVVHSLKIFKAKFAYFTEKVDRMDALFDVTFTALAATGSPLSRCGRCNRYMHFIPRRPSRLHCRTCDVTLAVPQTGTIKAEAHRAAAIVAADTLYKELKCPLDGFELLLSVNSGGKCFSFCPLCYNDPPFEQQQEQKQQQEQQQQQSEMRSAPSVSLNNSSNSSSSSSNSSNGSSSNSRKLRRLQSPKMNAKAAAQIHLRLPAAAVAAAVAAASNVHKLRFSFLLLLLLPLAAAGAKFFSDAIYRGKVWLPGFLLTSMSDWTAVRPAVAAAADAAAVGPAVGGADAAAVAPAGAAAAAGWDYRAAGLRLVRSRVE
ncbi:hypothetical protein Emed_001527 [Eimeria media]